MRTSRNPLYPCLLCLLLALPISSAIAANFTVTLTGDAVDLNAGNGFCNILPQAGPGPCSLRAAIIESNALAGADTISLQAGEVITLSLAGAGEDAGYSGDLDITDNLSILFLASGQRPVVDANGLERAFQVLSGNLTLLGFDITGGDASVPGDGFGGAIAVGFDAGNVELAFMRLYGNRAQFGGALYNDGPDTEFSASEAYDNQHVTGFPDSSSSAIRNRGTLTIQNSSIFDNSGEGGNGAIAVANFPPNAGTALMTIINSTIADNIGIGVESEDASTLVVRNSTIVANSATGIRIQGADGTFQMRNSVIAKNDAQDCTISSDASLNLDRYNMDSDNTCRLSDGSSNYPDVEPYLTPLKRRDGATMASWPLTISPLLDAGHPTIGSIGCEAEDQYFVDRPIDFDGNGNARCDVGAIELDSDVIFFDPFEIL